MSTYKTGGVRALGVLDAASVERSPFGKDGDVAALAVRDEFGAVRTLPRIAMVQVPGDSKGDENAVAYFLALAIEHTPMRPDICSVSGYWLVTMPEFLAKHEGIEGDDACVKQLDAARRSVSRRLAGRGCGG